MFGKQKILIVDDDENIAELISLYLTKECFDTKLVYDGEDALAAFDSYQPNLILLDLMLPGIDGYQVCREIRHTSDVPIIMLSAKGETFDKVLGLELGADDYMTKPFDLYELLARIEANLKRTVDNPYQNNNTLVYKDIKINNSLVYINGVLVPFTSTELSILKLLLQYPQKIFSKQNLYESIWNEPYAYDDDTINTLSLIHI